MQEAKSFLSSLSPASISSLFQSMREFLNTYVPYFNRLPPSIQTSLMVGVPVYLTAQGYLSSQHRQLMDTARHVQRFHTGAIQEIQHWRVWQIEDRLYSMSDVTAAELAQHRGISLKVSKCSEAIGRLRTELEGFWLLGKLEALQTRRRWGVQPAALGAGSLQSLHSQLDATAAALAVTDDMNLALLYLKKRFYPQARSSVNQALDKIKKLSSSSQLPSGIGALSQQVLYGQAYNIAAKVARAQNDYVNCNRHYELAIECLQGHADLSKVLGSQIALWSDIAWNAPAVPDEKASHASLTLGLPSSTVRDVFSKLCASVASGDTASIAGGSSPRDVSQVKRDAGHPAFLQSLLDGSLVDRFTQEPYSLGLTNLSWLLIQVALKANHLGLSTSQQAQCLQRAEALASQAIDLEQPLRGVSNTGAVMNEASSNAWLFRGIARMEQANPGVKADEKSSSSATTVSDSQKLYSAALQDFEKGLQLPSGQDHPSLLRRRAMVLEKLGDIEGAYQAYRLAQIEFRYRAANQELLGPHPLWLREIEKAVQDLRPKVQPNEKHEAIIKLLIAGDYLKANEQLRALPPDELWTQARRAWFDRHFQVDRDTGQVIPKARENFLARLGLYSAPSPYVFMALSAATYRAKHGQGLGSPSGWQPLAISSQLLPESVKSGYLAVAFQHTGTQQLIISHGGTDWTDPEDLRADVSLAWGKEYPQLEDAQRFTQQVMQLVRERAKSEAKREGVDLVNPISLADSKKEAKAGSMHTDSKLTVSPPDNQAPAPGTPLITYHTGHSLGGALAAYVACTRAPVGSHYAVTFDNPSSYWQINRWLYQDATQRWYTDRHNFPVTSYLTRPTFINCAGGPHLGRTMRLQLEPAQAQPLSSLVPATLSARGSQWVTDYLKSVPGLPVGAVAQWIEIAKANVACHSSALILNAVLDSPKPDQQYRRPVDYVLAWPEDLDKWRLFEEAMRESKQSAEALLHYIPPASVADDKSTYRLSSSQSHIVPGSASSEFRESIPLQALGSEFASLFKQLLKDGPLRPERFQQLLETNALTGTQQQLAEHLDFYVLSCLQLNASQDQLLLKGALSSWELFTYLRQQVQETCQKYPENTVAGILYPDLEHLPGLMQPPASPTHSAANPSTRQQIIPRNESASEFTPLIAATLYSETKEHKPPAPLSSYGTFSSLPTSSLSRSVSPLSASVPAAPPNNSGSSLTSLSSPSLFSNTALQLDASHVSSTSVSPGVRESKQTSLLTEAGSSSNSSEEAESTTTALKPGSINGS